MLKDSTSLPAVTDSAQYGVGLHAYKDALQANVQHIFSQEPQSFSAELLFFPTGPVLQVLAFALVEFLGVSVRSFPFPHLLNVLFFFHLNLPDISVENGK